MIKVITFVLSALLLFSFSSCKRDGNQPSAADNSTQMTTDENYQKLLADTQKCDRALESLYTENKADFEAAARAVLSLPDTDRLTIKASEGGNFIDAVTQNGSSVVFTDLFTEKDQEVILRCLEKMKEISPEKTDISIIKTEAISSGDMVRFEFSVQTVWVDLGLAYCEKNDTGYTHIERNFYRFYEGLV